MDVCDRKRGGYGAIMNYVHSAASIAHKEAKARMKGKKKEVTTISQRASKMRPRTLCLQHRFGTDSTLSWMDFRRNTVYAGQACHSGVIVPWRVAEYQPYKRWKFSEWFWWPRKTSKTRRWHTKSTSFKRLDSPGASFGCKPSLGTGKIYSVATSPSTVSGSSISAAARGGIDDRSLASASRGPTGDRWSMDTGNGSDWCASRGRRIHWGPVEYGHGNGSGLVCNRPIQPQRQSQKA